MTKESQIISENQARNVTYNNKSYAISHYTSPTITVCKVKSGKSIRNKDVCGKE